MNVRFYNAKIMTMENDLSIIEGELCVEGSKVAYVGPSNELSPKLAFDREIDLKGNLIMPGFKNAHTHSGMTGLRSFADDLKLQEWLETIIITHPYTVITTTTKIIQPKIIKKFCWSHIISFDTFFNFTFCF